MSNFDKFKKELKKECDIKTLVRKEKYWNDFNKDKSNMIRYEIFFNATPLTSRGDEIRELIKKYNYKSIEDNIVGRAYRSGNGFNHKIVIEINKEEII